MEMEILIEMESSLMVISFPSSQNAKNGVPLTKGCLQFVLENSFLNCGFQLHFH